MKSVNGIFAKFCKTKYTELGFIKKNSTFIRLKNDIIHSFSLKKSNYIPAMNIEFGICPLCHSQPIYFDVGPLELEDFVIKKDLLKSVWEYSPTDEESINSCIEKMMSFFDECVIPLFEESIDSKTALHALALLENRRNEAREKERLIFGLEKTVDKLNRNLFDSRYYYLALKAKDISLTRDYLKHWIAVTKDDIAMCDLPPYNEMVNRKKRANERLRHYTEQLSQLESNNWSYFEEQLAYNELAMLTKLSKEYPGIV